MIFEIIRKIKQNYKKHRLLNSSWFINMKIEEKKIFHIDTPDHGNLGDHMIAQAGNKYLLDNYPNYRIYELTISEYELLKKHLKEKIGDEDLLFLIGGGHFGNLYLHHEIRRREIIKMYPKNKIIILPQTITFTGKNSEKELEKTKQIFSEHRDLTIMCRENVSYKFAKNNFSNNIVLVPDMVNYLEGDNDKNYYIERDVLFLLRKDKEKVRDDKQIFEIEKILKENKKKYSFSDTHLGSIRIERNFRECYTSGLLREIGQSRVIVTDRLHGMILAIISKKPVIAFNSLDGKVEKSYETWYRNYNNVFYVDEKKELKNILTKALSFQNISDENITKEKLLEILKKQLIIK